MEKIVERTIGVADIILDESGRRFPPNLAFRQKNYQITVPIQEGDKGPMGRITLFGTDEELGTIVIDVYPDNAVINVPEGPARNYGQYLADELSISGHPCELKGIVTP
jgi:hypothetical protein